MKKVVVVLASIGFLDAAYLTWVKLANRLAVCAGVGDCEFVNSSIYSELFGLPIAIYGAAAYLLILLLVLFEDRNAFLVENGPLLVLGLTLAGVLYSAYLTYLELFVLHAICPYCVLSALMMLGLVIASGLRLQQHWSEV